MIAQLDAGFRRCAPAVPEDTSAESLLATLERLAVWGGGAPAAASIDEWANQTSALALARVDLLRTLLLNPRATSSSTTEPLVVRLMLCDLATATLHLRAATAEMRRSLDAVRADVIAAKASVDAPITSVAGPRRG